MNKQLLIGSLMLLPAGLNAMWTPYHNPGTVESMRAIVDKQVADARFHAEMMARQIHAQKQMTLEIAAEQQAAQAAQTVAPHATAQSIAPTQSAESIAAAEALSKAMNERRLAIQSGQYVLPKDDLTPEQMEARDIAHGYGYCYQK